MSVPLGLTGRGEGSGALELVQMLLLIFPKVPRATSSAFKEHYDPYGPGTTAVFVEGFASAFLWHASHRYHAIDEF